MPLQCVGALDILDNSEWQRRHRQTGGYPEQRSGGGASDGNALERRQR